MTSPRAEQSRSDADGVAEVEGCCDELAVTDTEPVAVTLGLAVSEGEVDWDGLPDVVNEAVVVRVGDCEGVSVSDLVKVPVTL